MRIVRRQPKIVSKQCTVADLIIQCNLVVANMQNEHTGAAHNRRLLIFNCAMAMRQLIDTLAARDNEIATLKAALDIATHAVSIVPPTVPDGGNGYTTGTDYPTDTGDNQ